MNMKKSYNYLNLQQKLMKIGKHIPNISKAHLNDAQEYEFATLDDLNVFLKPALNKYGVNFSILEECATQKDERGNSVYVRESGAGWVYESDLTVAWINVDRPEDMEKTVIHVIGTNAMPEKAKGAAMTYGLKYYLFRKFNISLTDKEDPDFYGKAAENDMPTKLEPSLEEHERCSEAEEKAERAAARIISQKREKQKTVQESPKTILISSAKEASAQPKTESDAVKSGRKEDGPQELKKHTQQPAFEEKPAEEPKEELPDGFQKAKEDEVPFEEEDRLMRDILNGMEQEKKAAECVDTVEPKKDNPQEEWPTKAMEAKEIEASAGEMTVEQAKKVICKMGNFLGRPFGDILMDPERGRKMLIWILNRYKGDDDTQVKAARALLPVYESIHGKAA